MSHHDKVVVVSDEERKLLDNIQKNNGYPNHQLHHHHQSGYNSPRGMGSSKPFSAKFDIDQQQQQQQDNDDSDPIERELRRKMMNMLSSNTTTSSSNSSSTNSSTFSSNMEYSRNKSSSKNKSNNGGISNLSLNISTSSTNTSYQNHSIDDLNLDEVYVTCERERIKQYANECRWDIVMDYKILREFRIYAVEEWIFKPNHLWSAIEYTGNAQDEIIVTVIKPNQNSIDNQNNNNNINNNIQQQQNHKSLLSMFTSKTNSNSFYPMKTSVGQLIVAGSSVTQSNSGLNLIPLKSGEFDKNINILKLNLSLKRLGCTKPRYQLSTAPLGEECFRAFELLSGIPQTNLITVCSFVMEVQAALSHLNYLPLLTRIDGQYDQKTINAVKAFQYDKRLKDTIQVEGFIDLNTFNEIEEEINILKKKLESLGFKTPTDPIKEYKAFNELMKSFQHSYSIYPDAPGKNILIYMEKIVNNNNSSNSNRSHHHHHHHHHHSNSVPKYQNYQNLKNEMNQQQDQYVNNNNNNQQQQDQSMDDDYEHDSEYEDDYDTKSERSFVDVESSYSESEGSVGGDILSSPQPSRHKYINNNNNNNTNTSTPLSNLSSPSITPNQMTSSPSTASPLTQSIQNLLNRSGKNIVNNQNNNKQSNQQSSSTNQNLQLQEHLHNLQASTDDDDFGESPLYTEAALEEIRKLETPAEAEEKQKLKESIVKLEKQLEQQQKDYQLLKREFDELADSYINLKDQSSRALALFSTNEKLLEATNQKIGTIYKDLPLIEEKVNLNIDTIQSYSNRIKRLDDIVLSVQKKNERNIFTSSLLSIISLIAVAFAYLIMFISGIKRKYFTSSNPTKPSSEEDLKKFISQQRLKIHEYIDDLDQREND